MDPVPRWQTLAHSMPMKTIRNAGGLTKEYGLQLNIISNNAKGSNPQALPPSTTEVYSTK